MNNKKLVTMQKASMMNWMKGEALKKGLLFKI